MHCDAIQKISDFPDCVDTAEMQRDYCFNAAGTSWRIDEAI
jgi:hypothetical protein